MTEIKTKGLAELQKIMNQLPAKLEANIMRGALRAGAVVIRDAVKSNINSVSGHLASTMRVSTRIEKRAGKVVAKVKADAYYAGFVEYGTRPHYISVPDSEKLINSRRSRKLGKEVREHMKTFNTRQRSLKIGQQYVGPGVFHPGAKPKPFMRPALDNNSGAAITAAAEYIKKRLATKHGIDTPDINVGLAGDDE
ncbi:MAG: HK97 gp10 family phage protein [Nitrosomonas sp.]|nr:HK97 gp10 family phage protein [Nitrosomonas sp.]